MSSEQRSDVGSCALSPEERLSFPPGVIRSSVGASAWAVLPCSHCPPLKSMLWVHSGSSCSCRHLEGLCLQCSEVRALWDSRALSACHVPACLYPTSSHQNAQTKLLTDRRWSSFGPACLGGSLQCEHRCSSTSCRAGCWESPVGWDTAPSSQLQQDSS